MRWVWVVELVAGFTLSLEFCLRYGLRSPGWWRDSAGVVIMGLMGTWAFLMGMSLLSLAFRVWPALWLVGMTLMNLMLLGFSLLLAREQSATKPAKRGHPGRDRR